MNSSNRQSSFNSKINRKHRIQFIKCENYEQLKFQRSFFLFILTSIVVKMIAKKKKDCILKSFIMIIEKKYLSFLLLRGSFF